MQTLIVETTITLDLRVRVERVENVLERRGALWFVCRTRGGAFAMISADSADLALSNVAGYAECQRLATTQTRSPENAKIAGARS